MESLKNLKKVFWKDIYQEIDNTKFINYKKGNILNNGHA